MAEKEIRRFRLVYEDSDGYIKGSYSGIPGKDDVVLIKRAVLEGIEPPTPAPGPTPGPTPTGNIEITTTEQVSVAGYATAQVIEPNLVAENIKKGVSILGVVGTLEDSLDALMQETF